MKKTITAILVASIFSATSTAGEMKTAPHVGYGDINGGQANYLVTYNGGDNNHHAIDSATSITISGDGKVSMMVVGEYNEETNDFDLNQRVSFDAVTESELSEIETQVTSNSGSIANLEESVEKNTQDIDKLKSTALNASYLSTEAIKRTDVLSDQVDNIASYTDNLALKLDEEVAEFDKKLIEQEVVQKAVDSDQDTAIKKVESDSLSRDIALGQAINDTQETLEKEVTRIDKKNDEQDTAISVNREYTKKEVARLDQYNDYQDRRMTVAEQELYSTTSRSISNEKRIGKLETKVEGLESDVNRLDGMIAAQQAANSMIIPNAKFAVGVGVGYYRDHTGLALGALHKGKGYSVKATVSGTDADQWKDLAVGVGVNFIIK